MTPDTVKALFDALQVKAEIIENSGRGHPAAVVPAGVEIRDLERFAEQPYRPRGEIEMSNPYDVAVYVARFVTDATVAMLSLENRTLRAVIDYHFPVAKGGAAGWREHKVAYKARFDPRYAAWREIEGKPLSQMDLGMFLEDRMGDIHKPDAASVLESVLAFRSTRKVEFEKSTRLSSGEVEIAFSDKEDNHKTTLRFPEQVILRLPVYEFGPPQDTLVRLRHRPKDGNVSFFIQIHDREVSEMAAFAAATEAAVESLKMIDVPVYAAK